MGNLDLDNDHVLEFVRWHKPANTQNIHFHCKITDDDLNSCNIELWKKELYDIGRDVLSQFTIYMVNSILVNLQPAKKIQFVIYKALFFICRFLLVVLVFGAINVFTNFELYGKYSTMDYCSI